MKLLRFFDVDGVEHAINLDHVIELKEDENAHTVVVTLKSEIILGLTLSETLDGLEETKDATVTNIEFRD